MKALKLIWYPSMAILLGAGLLTGRRELFVMLFFMGMVMLYSLALNLWTIFSFSFTQEVSEPVTVKGASPELRISIHNDKPFPFTLMRILVETAPYGEPQVLSFTLPPKSSRRFQLSLPCAYRGFYQVGMATLEVNDVFGLLTSRMDMRNLPYYRQRSLKVYPRLLQLTALPSHMADAKFRGGGVQIFADHGESFSDVRRYRPGDPLKRIHRVASARRRELYVKSYDVPMESTALLALDFLGGEGETALALGDLACECAATIALYNLEMGYSVTMTEVSGASLEVSGPADFPKLYDRLVIAPLDRPGPLADYLEAAAAAHPHVKAVYAITAAPDQALVRALTRLSAQGRAVSCLLLSAGGPEVRAPVPDMAAVHSISLQVGDDVRAALGELL